MTTEQQTKVAGEFRFQSNACAKIGSPLYAELCERVAHDVEEGGSCWSVLAPFADLRFGLALPLRFLGGVHRLAHLGLAAELAAQYPSTGGTPTDQLWASFLEVIAREEAEVVAALDRDVQTNEVVRTSALSEGLRSIQAKTGRALALREIGTSAGLNLRMDRFAYVDGDRTGGDPSSPLRIVDRWRGATRPSLAPLTIADRAGCDPNPIDASTADGRATLLGFLWPDQVDRLDRTSAAIAIAAESPARIERANAEPWLARELDGRAEGVVTVVFHSIVWPYIDKTERKRITELIEDAGANVAPQSPLAWMRFEVQEPNRSCAALTLRIWDGRDEQGAERELATAGFHGEWVELH